MQQIIKFIGFIKKIVGIPTTKKKEGTEGKDGWFHQLFNKVVKHL